MTFDEWREAWKNYDALWTVLMESWEQAAFGKGKERHASGELFTEQPICQISREVGIGFALGQAQKKIIESQRLDTEAGVRELLGAINYIAAAVIVRRENP